jgi:hypothetical protein
MERNAFAALEAEGRSRSWGIVKVERVYDAP